MPRRVHHWILCRQLERLSAVRRWLLRVQWRHYHQLHSVPTIRTLFARRRVPRRLPVDPLCKQRFHMLCMRFELLDLQWRLVNGLHFVPSRHAPPHRWCVRVQVRLHVNRQRLCSER